MSKEPMTDEQIKNIVNKLLNKFITKGTLPGEHRQMILLEEEVDVLEFDITQSLQKYGEMVREETEEAIFNTLKQDKEVARELPHPIEAIKFRMEQSGLKQKDMLPYFGTRGRVSEVLNLVRPLTIRMIRRLVAGLDIPAEVLIQKYELTSLTKQEKGQR